MNCPKCLSKNTGVTNTYKPTESESDTIVRRRKCKDCGHSFKTFEGYEPADVELCFRVKDARLCLNRVLGWTLKRSKRDPLLRDIRKYLTKVLNYLEDPEERADSEAVPEVAPSEANKEKLGQLTVPRPEPVVSPVKLSSEEEGLDPWKEEEELLS